jgi:peptidyl-prolyl cis-trans isomerase B (cyclophilin B)
MKKSFLSFLLVFVISLTSIFCQTAPSNPSNPQYQITVTRSGKEIGTIKLEIYKDKAPLHARNFDSLVSVKFYDGTAFHRVIPGFMIQGGGPNSKDPQVARKLWGSSADGQTTVPAEFSKTMKHLRGTLSAARSSDPNSATSQFFICVDEVESLDEKYSIYGQVLDGMDVVDNIVESPRDERDNPNERIEMKIVKIK